MAEVDSSGAACAAWPATIAAAAVRTVRDVIIVFPMACGRTKELPLFVKQRFPVRGHRSDRSRDRLIHGMTVRSLELRAGEEFFRTIIVKPPLARFEARDDRVTRSGAVFRCMLIR